jgi:hypothetical protein
MMKQMPYRVEEGAVERAKLRAKMAVREAKASQQMQQGAPQERVALRPALRWALSGVAATVLLLLAVSIFMQNDNRNAMERLVCELNLASEELVYEQMADVVYYAEEDSSLQEI